MPVVDLTSDGLDIAVLLFPHEWSASLSIAHRFPGSVTAGQSGREGRRPKGEEIRHKLAIHLVIEGDEAQAFRELLATIGKGWVGVPLWKDQRLGSDWANRVYDAERIYDLTDDAIVENGDVLDDAHVYAPLLVGHLVELPPESAENATLGEFSFSVVEDSPFDLRIGINAVGAAGTWPATIEPDWNEAAEEKPSRDLRFDQIGSQREQTIDNEESVFRWGQSAPFTFKSDAELRTILAFFAASEGLRRKFTTPMWFAPGEASSVAPHSTKARFASDTLTLDYLCGCVASARIEVVQVPWELVGVEGEEPEQPPRVFFYRYKYKLPVPVFYRFTNWPRALVRAGDGTYAPAPMLHRDSADALDVRSNRLVVDSFDFPGNPLLLWQPNRIEAPLELEVFESETWPIDPDAAVLIFKGDVKRPKRQSRSLEASVIFLAGLLEREFPRVRLGPSCNTSFCSRLCGLVHADFEIAGTFEVADGCHLSIDTAAADAENFFAGGMIEIGVGADWEQRQIIASEPIVGGQLITVDWPVRQAAASQAVVFARGCPRTWEACQALGNADRFRGHPHVPTTNLSLPAMALPSAPGKK